MWFPKKEQEKAKRCTLRCFAATTSDDIADEVGRRIIHSLPLDVIVESMNVQVYWKVTAWREILVQLLVRRTVRDALDITSALGNGWEIREMGTEGFAVWNRMELATFVDERVTWACLDCYEVQDE